jgi:hypothetical protein
MSKFYTDVVCLGDYIFERGIENGIPFEERHAYKPTLYIPTTSNTALFSGDLSKKLVLQ